MECYSVSHNIKVNSLNYHDIGKNIMTVRRLIATFSLFLSLFSSAAAYAQFGGDIAPVSSAVLISEASEVAAGSTFHAALHVRMKSGWHSYWKNPGDAGLPISLAWAQTEGVTTGDLIWPPPQVIAEGPLVTYGYMNEVVLPVQISIGKDVAVGMLLTLHARADWLACENICVPQSAELTLDVKMSGQTMTDPAANLVIARALARQPTIITQHVQALWKEKTVQLVVPFSTLGTSAERVTQAQFFPEQQNWMNYSTAQTYAQEHASLTLTLPRANADAEPIKAMHGVLALAFADGKTAAFDIRASPNAAQASLQLPRMILFALLGGLILNLMPCVFPVLSLKALALAKHASLHPRHARAEGVSYTAGVLVSFALLAAILIGLKAAGESIGWGFQMQSPVFVGTLVFLLFLVGLNLSGLFELPVLLGGLGHGVTQTGSLRGSFLTGVLAAAIATPCTAPFMATALGFAISAPPVAAMVIFLSLGFGLALPFLLIGFVPALAKLLPRPGTWMGRLRGVLAFPMYLSVIWLLWVLKQQAGANGIMLMLFSMAGILFALWLKRSNSASKVARRLFVWPLLLVLPVATLTMLHRTEFTSASSLVAADEVPYSASALETLRTQKRPVFLDATAAWCITCQVNKRLALSSERIHAEFKKRGIIVMVADWTNENPEITQLLQSFGHSGVPMNVYFPPEGEPVVLPQVLTESIVLDTIGAR